METSPPDERAARDSERYRTLLEINNAIIASLTRDALFQAVAEALRRVIPFDRTAIFLHDPRRDVLTLYVLQSSLSSRYFVVGLEVAADDSHVGRVFRRREPLLRRDLAAERQFPAEDLQEVANQVALAVENMKAYEEIAALKARLEHENVYLQEEIRGEHNFVETVGSSPALLAVLRKVESLAPTDTTVLVLGETGTGKELIARAIHDRSTRKKRRSSLGTWIYRIATNMALNKRRGKRLEVEVSLEEHLPTFLEDGHRQGDRTFLLADWSQNPEEELLSGEGRVVVSRAIEVLPAQYRAVLILRDVEELTNEEAAQVLGESVASVKSRLHRARMALREQLTHALAR